MCQAWGESAAHSHTHSPPRLLGIGSDPRRGSGCRLLLQGCVCRLSAFFLQWKRARAGRSGQEERARPARSGAGAPEPGFRTWGPGSGPRSGAAAALRACASAARPPLARQPRGRPLSRGSPPALPSPLPPRPARARPFLPRRGARRLHTSPAGVLERRGPGPAAAGWSAPSRARRPAGRTGVAALGLCSRPRRGEPPPPPRWQPRRRPRTPSERRHCGCRADRAPGRNFLPLLPGLDEPLPFVSGSRGSALSVVRLRPG